MCAQKAHAGVGFSVPERRPRTILRQPTPTKLPTKNGPEIIDFRPVLKFPAALATAFSLSATSPQIASIVRSGHTSTGHTSGHTLGVDPLRLARKRNKKDERRQFFRPPPSRQPGGVCLPRRWRPLALPPVAASRQMSTLQRRARLRMFVLTLSGIAGRALRSSREPRLLRGPRLPEFVEKALEGGGCAY
jgi:hypothetical protein